MREFWLNTRLERIYKDSDASCPDDEIHVVEYKAYQEQKQKADYFENVWKIYSKRYSDYKAETLKLAEQVKVLKEALQWYADQNVENDHVLGNRARLALEKINEI